MEISVRSTSDEIDLFRAPPASPTPPPPARCRWRRSRRPARCGWTWWTWRWPRPCGRPAGAGRARTWRSPSRREGGRSSAGASPPSAAPTPGSTSTWTSLFPNRCADINTFFFISRKKYLGSFPQTFTFRVTETAAARREFNIKITQVSCCCTKVPF